MIKLISHHFLNSGNWYWQIALILCLSLGLYITASYLLRNLLQKTKKSPLLWDEALVLASIKPISFCIVMLGFCWIVEIFQAQFSLQGLFTRTDRLIALSIIASTLWFLLNFVAHFKRKLLNTRTVRIDETTIQATGRIAKIIITIFGGLIILQTLGISTSGVLAFGGFGGVAIGFAAKDLLANFFGGLVICLNRPFEVGNWIRSPDKAIEGTVEYIGWRQTIIRTFDRRPLYIPNATFTTIVVENASRMQNRRIKEIIGLRYKDGSKINAITEDIEQYLQNHPSIDTMHRVVFVNFTHFGHSSLDLMVYCFTKTTDWLGFLKIKQEILLQIMHIIHAHEADIAFPTRTLDCPSLDLTPQEHPALAVNKSQPSESP